MTKLRLLTPPAEPPVTLAEAKDWLRVDGFHDDAIIGALILSATNLLDGRNGILGRCLEPQTWELVLDRFPPAEIRIPLGPVASVASVGFTAPAGSEQTLSPEAYVLAAATFCADLVPTAAWPATASVPNAVRIRFVAGTGTPESVRHAVLAMVAEKYDDRGGGRMLTGGIVADLAPFRRPVVL